jgi:hypothetical protein
MRGKSRLRDLGIGECQPIAYHPSGAATCRRRYAGSTRGCACWAISIDLSRPGRELLEDLRAHKEERRRQYDELEETQRETDRLLLANCWICT